MGAFWSVINPLGHLLLYTFVFNIILKVRFSSDPSTANFALYLMTGLLPWSAISESLSRATTAVLEVPNLVKRVVFPLEILPVVVALSSLSSALLAFVALVIFAAVSMHGLNWTIIYLPLVIFSQLLFMVGMSWFLASLGVYIRDIRHLISLFLSAWMYTTPIVYPATSFPAHLKWLLVVNPAAGVVGDYRRVLLQGLAPDWSLYSVYTLLGVLLCTAGYHFFYKTKRSFADVM